MAAVFTIINVIGLLALGIGFLWKDRRCHILRILGWSGLAIYWGGKAPGYFEVDDIINGLGAAMAFPIFGFLSFHEWRSWKWDEEYHPLRFVTGATFIAGMGYFLVGQLPVIEKLLVDVVAHHSVALANLSGYGFTAGEVILDSEGIYVPILRDGPTWIHIILDCTAIQAIIVAGAFLFGCRGDTKSRGMMFLIFLPVIYFTNVIRNAIVIIMVEKNGPAYFEFAHNIIGKTLSLTVLIILILVAFWRVPGLYEDINGMFELPWRNRPGHDYMSNIGRLYDSGNKGDGCKSEGEGDPGE